MTCENSCVFFVIACFLSLFFFFYCCIYRLAELCESLLVAVILSTVLAILGDCCKLQHCGVRLSEKVCACGNYKKSWQNNSNQNNNNNHRTETQPSATFVEPMPMDPQIPYFMTATGLRMILMMRGN